MPWFYLLLKLKYVILFITYECIAKEEAMLRRFIKLGIIIFILFLINKAFGGSEDYMVGYVYLQEDVVSRCCR